MIRHPFLDGAPAPPPLADVGVPRLPLVARGKVRELYDLGDQLLVVATDRLSAFDVVLPDPIPGKGIVLSSLSAFWFEQLADLVPTHYLSDDPAAWPVAAARHADRLRGRAMLVRRCQRLDVECVVRGYLAGSGWAEYRRTGTLGGEPLAAGLVEASRLPVPRFTPTTKATEGHDRPLDRAALSTLVGADLATALERLSLAVYARVHAHALARGIILADTKLEFGLLEDRLILIDEVATPDSSRFWPADRWRPGAAPPSLDKQPIRDLLTRGGWDGQDPVPSLSPDVIRATSERYREAFQRLTGPA